MKDVGHSLHMETQAAKTLLAQMADILGDDETAKQDAVEGETSLREAIAAAVKQIGEDEASVLGLTEYVGTLSDRRERLKERIANMRTAVCIAMEQAHEKTLETAFGTVTTKATPKTAIITEEADIPADYWKPQPDSEPLVGAEFAPEILIVGPNEPARRQPAFPGSGGRGGPAAFTLPWR